MTDRREVKAPPLEIRWPKGQSCLSPSCCPQEHFFPSHHGQKFLNLHRQFVLSGKVVNTESAGRTGFTGGGLGVLLGGKGSTRNEIHPWLIVQFLKQNY